MNEKSPKTEEEQKVKIETPSPSDARDIAQLLFDTWVATYPNTELGIGKEDVQTHFASRLSDEAIAKSAQRIENLNPKEKLFVARIEGKIIGVCRLALYPEHNELQLFYVRPESQSSGVGRTLWAKAQTYLVTSKDTFVNVATYNIRAIHFYENLGFKDTGERLSQERFRMPNGIIIPEMRMKLQKNSQKFHTESTTPPLVAG